MFVEQVDNARGIGHARFSSTGDFIVAVSDGHLHIWHAVKAYMGTFIASVNIHSMGGFPITVDSQRNFVATGSTLSTAVKVWDLDKIWTCGGAQLQVRVRACLLRLILSLTLLLLMYIDLR